MNTQTQEMLVSLTPYFVVIGILLAFIVFCIIMAIKSAKYRRVQKNRVKELQTQGMLHTLKSLHLNGLPVPEEAPCSILMYKDRMEFQSGTTIVTLNMSKIVDMLIKTETEIQQQYVSSVGGAIGGAVLFGAIGAMIGGRAKKKTTSSISYVLIITYLDSNGNRAFLGFDVDSEANKMVKEFKELNGGRTTHIEL